MSETKIPKFHIYGDFTDEELISAVRARHLNEEQAFALEATLERLRTLIDGLIKAVEPFADFATRLGLVSDDNIVASDGNGGLGPYATRILTVGDLRRAREAYLKAKGV